MSEAASGTPAEGGPEFPKPPPSGAPSGTIFVGVLLTFSTIVLGALLAWVYFAEKPAMIVKTGESRLAIVGEVPDFKLTNRDGKPLARADLLGKIWIADFIFTRCPGSCPVMTGAMRGLEKTIAGDSALAPHVRFVSFTVDPNHDDAEVMEHYAWEFDAARDGWYFLTGPEPDIRKLAIGGFKLGIVTNDPASDEEGIVHSQSFVLVDDKARIRGYYKGNDEMEVKRLAADVRKLSKELPPARD